MQMKIPHETIGGGAGTSIRFLGQPGGSAVLSMQDEAARFSLGPACSGSASLSAAVIRISILP